MMLQALYQALYVDSSAFQWIHFTPHGIIRGKLSPANYGWNPFGNITFKHVKN